MSGFLRRIVDLVRTSLNSLIERAEDPEKMLDQMMRDMQSSYDRSRIEVARVLAEKHRLGAQLQKASHEMQDWERKAILALKSGNEPLARRALERKRASVELAAGYQAQLEEQASVTEKLKEALHALENKMSEARVKRTLLSARHQRALAQKRIHKALEASGSGTAFDNMARLEAKIVELEVDTLAAAELTEGTLEGKFLQLAESDVEEDLLLLKAKMSDAKALPPASG